MAHVDRALQDGAQRISLEPCESQGPGSDREAPGSVLLGRERRASPRVCAATGRTSPLNRFAAKRPSLSRRPFDFASNRYFACFSCFSCSSMAAIVFSTSAFIGLLGSSLRYC